MRTSPGEPSKITTRLATREEDATPPVSRWTRRSTAFRRVAIARAYSQGARRGLRRGPTGSDSPPVPDGAALVRIFPAQPPGQLAAFGRGRTWPRNARMSDVLRLYGTWGHFGRSATARRPNARWPGSFRPSPSGMSLPNGAPAKHRLPPGGVRLGGVRTPDRGLRSSTGGSSAWRGETHDRTGPGIQGICNLAWRQTRARRDPDGFEPYPLPGARQGSDKAFVWSFGRFHTYHVPLFHSVHVNTV